MLTVLLSSLLAAAPAPAAVPVYFQHRDWLLMCDNTRTCRAAGYALPDTSSLSLLLTREGGPQQPVQGRMSINPGDYESIAHPPFRLQIKRRDLGPLGDADAEGSHALSAAQVTAVLAALRGNGGIELVDRAGHHWPLSDKGAAAVMLKMDEAQGRLRTPGALMRKGRRAESSVPPALPAPRITRVIPATDAEDHAALEASPALRGALLATTDGSECGGLLPAEDDRTDTNQPLTVRRLDADHLLVSVQCWMGAYNLGEGYWVVNAQPPYTPQQAVTMDGNGYQDGEISADHKGRGMGDCRTHAAWVWDGRRFVASAEYSTGLCRLVPGGTWHLPALISVED